MPRDRIPRLLERVRRLATVAATLISMAAWGGTARAQDASDGRVAGVVRDSTGMPVAGAVVSIERTSVRSTSDAAGAFVLAPAPAGVHTLRTTRLGYRPARTAITVPARGQVDVIVVLARQAASLERVVVTADPIGRARGELATASVVDREAMENQPAASVGDLLALVPGTTIAAPGLDAASQASLRAAPLAGGQDPNSLSVRNRSAEQLAAFGTPIIVDGVPTSNNANLQSLGARGEFALASTADGGIDLRRIPAAIVERIEVLRGVPSVRYGDLTTAAILIETRVGAVPPTATLRWDERTAQLFASAGREASAEAPTRQAVAITGDVARTRATSAIDGLAPTTTRAAISTAHRLARRTPRDSVDRLTLDSHLDAYLLRQRDPETRDTLQPWLEGRESGFRLSSRLRSSLGKGARLEVTSAIEAARQRAASAAPVTRDTAPITDRLEPGRSIGRFFHGTYRSELSVQGAPRHLYERIEVSAPLRMLGFSHVARVGGEARREWTGGAGIEFDPRTPPQNLDYRFDPRFRPRGKTPIGIRGWDRPRRFDDVPPLVTSSLYADDWATRQIGGAVLELQGGVRVDVMHRGDWWVSRARDAVVQPRLTGQLTPRPGMRFRLSGGRVAKAPSLADLYPGRQWWDVVNVAWDPPDTNERLAVMTTFSHDPTNPDLGYARADKVEAGFDLDLGPSLGLISISAYDDRIAGAVGIALQPSYVLRDLYQLDDSTFGTGHPPSIIEPPYDHDTLPVLLQQPTNNVTLAERGIEVVLATPELPGLRTRVEIQGAWQRSRLRRVGIEVGSSFELFQIAPQVRRTAYWDGTTRVGERALLTTRLLHQLPSRGLSLTATVQHALRDVHRDIAGTDTLSFAGYLTRDGRVVPIPREDVYMAQYQDLRHHRSGYASEERRTRGDWLVTFQALKSLPRDMRLLFYAYNALDRRGMGYDAFGSRVRTFAPRRIGVQLTAPLGG